MIKPYYYLDTKHIFSIMRRYNYANRNGGEYSMNVGSLMDKCKSIQLGNQKSIVKEADDKSIGVASPALLIAKPDTKQTKQSRY